MSASIVTLFEAKTHLSSLIAEAVDQGKEITITRRGQEVAKIIPIYPMVKRNVFEVVDDIKALRKEIGKSGRLTLKEIKAMKKEGRR